MEELIEILTGVINTINLWVWGPWLLILLLGTHIFMTVRTGFIQRKLGTAIKLSFLRKKDSETGDVSLFGAFTTALASTVGTGNIVGVSIAIAIGGPGAVFWLAVTGILGMATSYAESLIAVKYRVKTETGTMSGGAMYALERGLKLKWLGAAFAICAAFAAFGIGNGVQANAIAVLVNNTFGVETSLTGIVLTVLTGCVLIGGVKEISNVCGRMVPFMCVLYIAGCILLICINIKSLGSAIAVILSGAFLPKAAGGGFIASTLMSAARHGLQSGLLSNEAGMGSAPIVAAAAQTRNPVRQALVSSTVTFWDTVVVSLLTGLAVVTSVCANPGIVPLTSAGTIEGEVLVHKVFSQLPVIGPVVITVGLFLFGFSTILGWSYYGERSAEYLLGAKSNVPYRVVFLFITYLSTAVPLGMIWNLSNILNALMAIPNLIAVILLSGVIASETGKFIPPEHISDTDDTLVS